MFQFTHTLNEGTENETIVNESRYIGDAPNNYVYFNCDEQVENQEYNYAESCEVWRIIGVFDVERTDPEDSSKTIIEQRMKLVRGSDFASIMSWNSNYQNDWTAANASLKNFLNGDYYNRTGDAATYGLKISAQEKIGDAVYYLGAVSKDSTNGTFGSTEKIYGEERGITVCKDCNTDTAKLAWIGKVGLMYPSDEYMAYGNGVNETCYTNPYGCSGLNASTGWVFRSNIREGQSISNTWLLSSISTRSDVLYVNNDGKLPGASMSLYGGCGVRPVVYLKSSIKIKSGTGEEGNPYVLE